jgi:hypothetical protein
VVYDVISKSGRECVKQGRDVSVVGKLKRHERAAIAAVAKRFAAKWEVSEESCSAVLSIGRKRIAVEVASVKQRIAGETNRTKSGLRRDKVVVRLVTRLRSALRELVPGGLTVIVTVTAPIRLASKTAAALEEKIRACLARSSSLGMRRDETIHGNQVRVRFVKSRTQRAPKLIGLVHNPDTDPDMLLKVARSLLSGIGAAAERCAANRSARERWLVLVIEGGPWNVEIYRQVHAALCIATNFAKILLAFPGGRVETLTG